MCRYRHTVTDVVNKNRTSARSEIKQGLRMNLEFNSKTIPKDARWQDLIPQLKCPQCQMYQGSNISNLERHVILHCKCRPTLMKNHYIKKLKQLSATEEDVLDYVRLSLEAKLLQWRKEGMPEIPLLLRHNENNQQSQISIFSKLLDLWRLWHQEMDCVSLEFNTSELLQLMSEAESLDWEPCNDPLPSTKPQGDDMFNLELMSEISIKLKELHNLSHEDMSIEEEDFDNATIERLEREALRLSSLSQYDSKLFFTN